MPLYKSSNPFGPSALGSDSYRLKNRHEEGWFQPSSGNDQRSFPKNLDRQLIFVWWVLLSLGFIVLVGRVLYLQTISSSKLSIIAEGNRIRSVEIKASRGVIFDRFNTQLVTNVPKFSLAIIPVDLPADKEERTLILNEAAELSSTSTESLTSLVAKQPTFSYQPLIIKENISYNEALLDEIKIAELPGVVVKIDNKRQYLSTSTQSFSHVLGYIGKLTSDDLENFDENVYSFDDVVGKSGIELQYEDILRGHKGRQQIEVDATGETSEVLNYEPAVPGSDLTLTIDSELQAVAEESLQRVMNSYQKKRGAVIVMDPRSGEILSLVSLPTFDNTAFSEGISSQRFAELIQDEDKPLFNRALSGEYPSGSTFKIIVASGALSEGLITTNTGFNSVGGIRVSQWFFPDWKAGGHGWTTVVKALGESVNTFFYIIGGGLEDFVGLGVDRLNQYALEFGLSQRLGIDIPGESSGFFPSREWKEETIGERWYIGDTYNLSIGQGNILVTPLQVAAYTSVIANGGTLYKPYVVKEITHPDSQGVETIKPTVLNDNVVSPEIAAVIRQGLRYTTTQGSALQLGALPIAVGAKTGTAQWSSTKEPHAWITAFAPYQDPQIVVTVLVEEGQEGSRVAQPVARDILAWWAANR